MICILFNLFLMFDTFIKKKKKLPLELQLTD